MVFSQNKKLTYIKNNDLITINSDWKGTPVDNQDKFVNFEYPFKPKFSDVLKWKLGKKPQSEEKKADKFRLPIIEYDSISNLKTNEIIWLGHATFFLRLNGVNMIIDPVFYNIPLVKRYSRHAGKADDFLNLDYILLSHDHQDHCQKKSIAELTKNNPSAEILTGLRMDRLVKPWIQNSNKIQVAGWYQQYITKSIKIYFLPSRHWSKRSIGDTNERLWGAFVIQTDSVTIYFSGDTGYGNHFKQAKKLFPTIDIAIIGVGAYKPEWFMHPNHISPKDAVTGFNELGAKVFIPMHIATFDLSDEPISEPIKMLREFEKQEMINGHLRILNIGEKFSIIR